MLVHILVMAAQYLIWSGHITSRFYLLPENEWTELSLTLSQKGPEYTTWYFSDSVLAPKVAATRTASTAF
jgi:hypothetical protein